MLTTEAFNALLKTLEEPPLRVIFILATTEPHKLPLTIISRTQRFDFKLANKEELTTKLARIIKAEGYKLSDDALSLLVTAGQGSYRDAETILEKVLSSVKQQNKNETKAGEVEAILGYVSSNLVADFMTALLQNNRQYALDILKIIDSSGLNLNQFIRQILEAARGELLQKKQQNLRQVLNIVREFNTANLELKFAPIPILVLELAVFNLTTETGDNSGTPDTPEKDNISATNDSGSKTAIKTAEQIVETSMPKTHMEKALLEDSGSLLSASDYEKVFNGWGKFLVEAKKYNHYLVAVLTQVSLDKSDDGFLIFRVPLAFHQKRLEDKETIQTLKKMAVEIYGSPLKFRVIIDKDAVTQTTINSADGSNSNEKIIEDLFGAV
jgi:DNA polymerase-3 subunit gamma/tau